MVELTQDLQPTQTNCLLECYLLSDYKVEAWVDDILCTTKNSDFKDKLLQLEIIQILAQNVQVLYD